MTSRLLKIKKKLDALLKTHNVTWEELSALYSEKQPPKKQPEPVPTKREDDKPSEGQSPQETPEKGQTSKK